MAGMDYSTIDTKRARWGGQWESSVPDTEIILCLHLYKTSVCWRVKPSADSEAVYMGEINSGSFGFPEFDLRLQRCQDEWIYGIVLAKGKQRTASNCFAFCGFYDGYGKNRETAELRLRMFLAREEIPVSLIPYGQDAPDIVSAVAKERSEDSILESFSATAEVIERRAVDLLEAIDAYRARK